jgi:hypothetical protein
VVSNLYDHIVDQVPQPETSTTDQPQTFTQKLFGRKINDAFRSDTPWKEYQQSKDNFDRIKGVCNDLVRRNNNLIKLGSAYIQQKLPSNSELHPSSEIARQKRPEVVRDEFIREYEAVKKNHQVLKEPLQLRKIEISSVITEAKKEKKFFSIANSIPRMEKGLQEVQSYLRHSDQVDATLKQYEEMYGCAKQEANSRGSESVSQRLHETTPIKPQDANTFSPQSPDTNAVKYYSLTDPPRSQAKPV